MNRHKYTKLRRKRRGDAIAAHHADVVAFLSRYPTPGGTTTSLSIQSGWSTVINHNIYDTTYSKR